MRNNSEKQRAKTAKTAVRRCKLPRKQRTGAVSKSVHDDYENKYIIGHTFVVHATPSIFRPLFQILRASLLDARGPLIGVGCYATGEALWNPRG